MPYSFCIQSSHANALLRNMQADASITWTKLLIGVSAQGSNAEAAALMRYVHISPTKASRVSGSGLMSGYVYLLHKRLLLLHLGPFWQRGSMAATSAPEPHFVLQIIPACRLKSSHNSPSFLASRKRHWTMFIRWHWSWDKHELKPQDEVWLSV